MIVAFLLRYSRLLRARFPHRTFIISFSISFVTYLNTSQFNVVRFDTPLRSIPNPHSRARARTQTPPRSNMSRTTASRTFTRACAATLRASSSSTANRNVVGVFDFASNDVVGVARTGFGVGGRSRVFAATRGFAASSGDGTGDASSSSSSPMDEDAELRARYEALAKRFETAPSRQKRYILNKALTGKVSDDIDDSEGERDGGRKRALQTRVIDVNRTTKVTKGGDLTNFTAMVVVGNGDGVIGFGTGKAAEVGPAIDKAYKKAARSLVYVNRFENHTIYHEVKGKYCKTLCNMFPAPSGDGIVANSTVEAICQLAGIKNIKAKIHGSHHPHNTVRAVFAALEAVESPEDVATRTGATVYRI